MDRPRRLRPSLLLLGLSLAAALPSWSGESIGGLPLRLRCDQVLPAQFGAEAVLERLSDGARITLHAQERLSDLLPGAYRCDDRTVLVRLDDSPAGQALSVVGLPILELDSSGQEQSAAFGAQGFNEFSLAVYAWRLADGWPWPWVTHGSYWGGLSGICWRITVDGKPFAFDTALGAYRRADRTAMPITPEPSSRMLQAARLGDVIAAKGVTGILVRDLGRPGLLDPADELVTASLVAGSPPRVRVVHLGDLVGEQPIDIFTRDKPRGESRNRLAPDADNPLHQLSLRRQLIALGGMFALCAILMLRYRRLRRQSRRTISGDARLDRR